MYQLGAEPETPRPAAPLAQFARVALQVALILGIPAPAAPPYRGSGAASTVATPPVSLTHQSF